jgi:Family of unknown function (DUF6776)
MTTVVGSKQYRSVVVPYKPRRTGLIVSVVSVLLLIVAALSYWLGGYDIKEQYQRLQSDNERLTAKLSESESKRERVSQELANSALGADVDREAVNEIRATVREHQQTIADLNEEIGFYKGLMAPTEREKGLSIRSWNIYATSNPGRFQFKLVTQQLAHNHRLLKGNMTVTIVGQMLGQDETFQLSSLSEQAQSESIKLRFKYFQNFDGELQLPEGFEPQGVTIVARATTPKSVQIERNFGWVIQQ